MRFQQVGRAKVQNVGASFRKGTLEHKLNREKGRSGCLFLSEIWAELHELDADVCIGFRGVFGAKKALYDFENDHPVFFEWHLWHETDV